MEQKHFLCRIFCVFISAQPGCVHQGRNLYESATSVDILKFRPISLPFVAGTKIEVRQGAFGSSSHDEPGNEYSWDFAVPLGTPILAADSGTVMDVWQPEGGSGCDAAFANAAHNVKVQHVDGTVAQYVHVKAIVARGQKVARGERIASTAANGWLCYPHLHFGVYASVDQLYHSPQRHTIPIFFEGIGDGVARKGAKYIVP